MVSARDESLVVEWVVQAVSCLRQAEKQRPPLNNGGFIHVSFSCGSLLPQDGKQWASTKWHNLCTYYGLQCTVVSWTAKSQLWLTDRNVQFSFRLCLVLALWTNVLFLEPFVGCRCEKVQYCIRYAEVNTLSHTLVCSQTRIHMGNFLVPHDSNQIDFGGHKSILDFWKIFFYICESMGIARKLNGDSNLNQFFSPTHTHKHPFVEDRKSKHECNQFSCRPIFSTRGKSAILHGWPSLAVVSTLWVIRSKHTPPDRKSVV